MVIPREICGLVRGRVEQDALAPSSCSPADSKQRIEAGTYICSTYIYSTNNIVTDHAGQKPEDHRYHTDPGLTYEQSACAWQR
jgi:hypothetical protein